jgi:hypothetical protein
VKFAQNYIRPDGAPHTTGPNNLNTSNLNLPSSINNVLDIVGTTHLGAGGPVCVQNPVTVHIKGDLIIDNDVNACPAGQSPSLGVVVENGSIYVSPNVTHLYGFYSASGIPGIINTCSTGPGYPQPGQAGFDASSSGCGKQLVTDGLLMAKNIFFNRTANYLNGGGRATDTHPEIINFSGQLYASPPPGFADLGIGFGPPNNLFLLAPRF